MRTRITLRRAWPVALLVALVLSVPSGSVAGASGSSTLPTIVLVHGAWADNSSWSEVVQRLQHAGYDMAVPPNPLRGLADDAAYLASYLDTIDGPVVLVGHSYGGAVISNAAVGDPDIAALVFVNAFVPAAGESVVQLAAERPGSALAVPDPTSVFTLVPYGAGDVDLYVKPDVFATAFANDLRGSAAVLAAVQRPVTLSALTSPAGPPAWTSIPSWYLAGTRDGVLPLAQQLAMATRAGSTTRTTDAGHLPMLSKPAAVTSIIEAAADSTG